MWRYDGVKVGRLGVKGLIIIIIIIIIIIKVLIKCISVSQCTLHHDKKNCQCDTLYIKLKHKTQFLNKNVTSFVFIIKQHFLHF